MISIRQYFWLWALAAGLFSAFPAIDLQVARWFFTADGGWVGARQPFPAIRTLVPLAVILPVAAVLLLPAARALLCQHRWAKRLPALPPRMILFVLLSFALAPGLVVNILLKDHWGRARPAQITEFGGSRQFTPPLQPAFQCQRNCAFVSGDASAGFALLSIAFVARPGWRRRLSLAALAAGSLFGLIRILQGGHFLSDIVFSGLITTGVIWLLQRMILPPDPRGADTGPLSPSGKPP